MATMRGIRRTYGSAGVRKAPAVADKMLGKIATAPDKLAVLRDQALLLIGFGGALRRSELVALMAFLGEAERRTQGARRACEYFQRLTTMQRGRSLRLPIEGGS